MRGFIYNFTYVEKGVKCHGKNLLTQSVRKYDFQTSIHLELFQHSLRPRSSWKNISMDLGLENSTIQHLAK